MKKELTIEVRVTDMDVIKRFRRMVKRKLWRKARRNKRKVAE